MVSKGAVEVVDTPTPGFYSRLFLVPKAQGGWRPVIDLSPLNKFLSLTDFRMETVASVMSSVRPGDFMASIDLKDAYFQIPVHQSSRKFLRFTLDGTIYQFTCLCFGLATAPQVFTRVFNLVSEWAHQRGIRLLRYLDDWLIVASSALICHQHLQQVLQFTLSLGVVINQEKSDLNPSQKTIYLGMELDTLKEKIVPSLACREKLHQLPQEFLKNQWNSAKQFQVLLGILASLEKLVPGDKAESEREPFSSN